MWLTWAVLCVMLPGCKTTMLVTFPAGFVAFELMTGCRSRDIVPMAIAPTCTFCIACGRRRRRPAFQCSALMQINGQPLIGRSVLRRDVRLFEEMSHE